MVSFELEDDEIMALMQCASVGAQAAQALLGANARPMGSIFEKVQRQFSEQRTATVVPSSMNGKAAAKPTTVP